MQDCLALGVDFRPASTTSFLRTADVISLHCPLTHENHHLISDAALAKMRDGVMIINTSRGALIDIPPAAVIEAPGSGPRRMLPRPRRVYEEEGDLFFRVSSQTKSSPTTSFTAASSTFHRTCLITGHQAFFTRNALENIAATTVANLTEFENTGCLFERPTLK